MMDAMLSARKYSHLSPSNEWWQDGRKREQINDRAELLDRARRKTIELRTGTAYNRAVIVSQILKANGTTKLLRNRNWPDYVEPKILVGRVAGLLTLV